MGERSVLDLMFRSKKTGSGGKEATEELRGFEGALKRAADAAHKLKIAGGAVAGAIFSTVKMIDATAGAYARYGREVSELSTELNLSAEETSRLIQVADDFKVSADDLRLALEFATKGGFAPSIESLAQLADKLQGIESPTERAAMLAKIFGRNWATLMPLLSAGGDAIRENAAEISDSLILTEESIAKTREWEIALDQWQDRIEAAKIGLGSFLVEGLLPWFDIAEGMPGLLNEMGDRLFDFLVQLPNAPEGLKGWWREQQTLNAALEKSKDALEAGVAVDGWLEALHGVRDGAQDAAAAQMALVQSFSEVTAASLASTGLEEINAALEAGLITPEEYETALRNLGGEILNLSTPQLEAILMQARFKQSTGETKDAVLAEVEALKKLWEWLKKVGAGTTATSFTTPIHGAQHGMDLTVPQGFDRDNFLIGASSGERVKVTPPGGASQRTPAGGQVHIGQISVSVGPGANGRQIVDEMMAEISRRVRVASGSGAAFVGG
jgi:hypothetical protein